MDHFLAFSCLTDRWGKRAWGQAFYETTNLAWSVRISWRKCWSLLCYWWELRYDLLTTSPGKFISHAFVLPVFCVKLASMIFLFFTDETSFHDPTPRLHNRRYWAIIRVCSATRETRETRDTREKMKKKTQHSSFSFLSCVSHVLIKKSLKHLFCVSPNGRLIESTTPLGHLWYWGQLLQPF